MAKKENWKLAERLTTVYLALMASAFFLIVTPYAALSTTKQAVFHSICGGYCALLILFLLEGLLIGSYSFKILWNRIRPDSPVQILLLLYLGFTLISALLSKYPAAWSGGTREEGALTIGIYVLCFYGVSKFACPKKWIMYLSGGAVTLFSLLCILQFCGLNPLGLYPQGYNYFDGYKAYSGAYLGTIGNVDFVASFLCIVIPLVWIYLLRAKEKQRFWLLIPLLLSLFVLLRMWVLAGLVGVFAGALISIPFVGQFQKRGHCIYRSALAGCGILALLILYFVDFGSGLLHELHQILHGSLSETFGSGRFHIWENVLKRIPENFFFGTGPDTMIYAEIEPFQRYDENLNINLTAFIDTAHNEYLNILYHQGIFATLSYLGALGVALWRWLRQAGQKPAVAIFGGAVLCYALQAFFGISQLFTTPIFWVSLGLLDKFTNNRRTQ